MSQINTTFKPGLVDIILTGPTDALPIALTRDDMIIRIWNTSLTSSAIRGIAGGVHGRAIWIVLVTGRNLTFPGGHASAAVGTRLAVEDATNITTLALNRVIHFVYDGNFTGGGRWVQIGRAV